MSLCSTPPFAKTSNHGARIAAFFSPEPSLPEQSNSHAKRPKQKEQPVHAEHPEQKGQPVIDAEEQHADQICGSISAVFFGLQTGAGQEEIAHPELRGNPSLMQRSSCFRLRLS